MISHGIEGFHNSETTPHCMPLYFMNDHEGLQHACSPLHNLFFSRNSSSPNYSYPHALDGSLHASQRHFYDFLQGIVVGCCGGNGLEMSFFGNCPKKNMLHHGSPRFTTVQQHFVLPGPHSLTHSFTSHILRSYPPSHGWPWISMKTMVTWGTNLTPPTSLLRLFLGTWVCDGFGIQYDMNMESNVRNNSLGFSDTTHRSSFSSFLLFCSPDDNTTRFGIVIYPSQASFPVTVKVV